MIQKNVYVLFTNADDTDSHPFFSIPFHVAFYKDRFETILFSDVFFMTRFDSIIIFTLAG